MQLLAARIRVLEFTMLSTPTRASGFPHRRRELASLSIQYIGRTAVCRDSCSNIRRHLTDPTHLTYLTYPTHQTYPTYPTFQSRSRLCERERPAGDRQRDRPRRAGILLHEQPNRSTSGSSAPLSDCDP